MPIYEYKCNKCGATFEALIRSSSEAPQCPECNSKEVGRLMSAPAASHSEGSSGGHSHSCGCGCNCHCH
ncbi:MAG: zinc ribbon domain-containing protein [Thermoguttaceae bacterium]|nr:zinc ribbon domain-containing protein [Thermoguttaceae bacterium]